MDTTTISIIVAVLCIIGAAWAVPRLKAKSFSGLDKMIDNKIDERLSKK